MFGALIFITEETPPGYILFISNQTAALINIFM